MFLAQLPNSVDYSLYSLHIVLYLLSKSSRHAYTHARCMNKTTPITFKIPVALHASTNGLCVCPKVLFISQRIKKYITKTRLSKYIENLTSKN